MTRTVPTTPRRPKKGIEWPPERSLRGKPETSVSIQEVFDPPDGTGPIASIAGELVFGRVNPRQLRLLEPGAEDWPQQGEWPNLWWRFRGVLELSDAGLVLRSLDLEPVECPDPEQDTAPFLGVHPSLLRAIRPDLIVRLAVAQLASEREGLARASAKPERYSPTWLSAWQRRDEKLSTAMAAVESHYTGTRKGGRPPLDDKHYRTIAFTCIDLYADASAGHKSVHAALADRYGVSRKTVEAWIREARKRQFLAPGQAGKATFSPGPELFPGSSKKDEQ